MRWCVCGADSEPGVASALQMAAMALATQTGPSGIWGVQRTVAGSEGGLERSVGEVGTPVSHGRRRRKHPHWGEGSLPPEHLPAPASGPTWASHPPLAFLCRA